MTDDPEDEFEDGEELQLTPPADDYWWVPEDSEHALRWDCLQMALKHGTPPEKAVAQAGKFEKYILGTVREV